LIFFAKERLDSELAGYRLGEIAMRGGIAILSAACALALHGCGRSAPTPNAASGTEPSAAMSSAHADLMPRAPTTVAQWARGALLFDGLGNAHRTITTSVPEAQKYFDQGLRLMWAFNHDEATRSFAQAAALDPQCASCYWGVALTVGPNYNLPFLIEERAKVADEALGLARARRAHASPVEQALINALASRYPSAQPLDPVALHPILVAYADAMKVVAQQFPQDLDVQTLYAEALMNVNAWKLWTADGKAAPGTEQIVATLESVLARDPQHPGANHYYVHTLEASPHPERAVASAERLRTLMSSAGHLVHMPAHIMQRVGRYEEAAEANRRGAAADEAYVGRTQPLDYYPVMYTAHNYQFLAYSAAMEGRRAETVAAADNSRRVVSDEMLIAMPGADWYLAEAYTARVRFGLWDEILSMTPPNPKLTGLTGGYLYGRALALAARGRTDEARATLGELQALAAAVPADAPAGMNTIKDVLAVAVPIVRARIALSAGNPNDAITSLQQAVQAEDHLAYNEPRDWLVPVRHLLGAQLMRAGKFSEAERIYRQDLQQNPANGWALYGLGAALKAQGKNQEAARYARQFALAWRHADVTLTQSAF
jgi:tetratricopeptide (TPR) repeat protein